MGEREGEGGRVKTGCFGPFRNLTAQMNKRMRSDNDDEVRQTPDKLKDDIGCEMKYPRSSHRRTHTVV